MSDEAAADKGQVRVPGLGLEGTGVAGERTGRACGRAETFTCGMAVPLWPVPGSPAGLAQTQTSAPAPHPVEEGVQVRPENLHFRQCCWSGDHTLGTSQLKGICAGCGGAVGLRKG